ncbi:hypothetical protein BJX70DRAFT_339575 [Aspergillus crustosus]
MNEANCLVIGNAIVILPEGVVDLGDNIDGAYAGPRLVGLMALRKLGISYIVGNCYISTLCDGFTLKLLVLCLVHLCVWTLVIPLRCLALTWGNIYIHWRSRTHDPNQISL